MNSLVNNLSSTHISTGKTICILSVTLGFLAISWPKIIHPLIFGTPFKSDHHPRQELDDSEFRNSESAFPNGNEYFRKFQNMERRHHQSVYPDLHRREGSNKIETTNSPPPSPTHNRVPFSQNLPPGPRPGSRPIIGGNRHPHPFMGHSMGKGHQIHREQSSQSSFGAMGILMPMYTVGIIGFFVYTITKIIFKRDDEEGKQNSLNRKKPTSTNLSLDGIRDVPSNHLETSEQHRHLVKDIYGDETYADMLDEEDLDEWSSEDENEFMNEYFVNKQFHNDDTCTVCTQKQSVSSVLVGHEDNEFNTFINCRDEKRQHVNPPEVNGNNNLSSLYERVQDCLEKCGDIDVQPNSLEHHQCPAEDSEFLRNCHDKERQILIENSDETDKIDGAVKGTPLDEDNDEASSIESLANDSEKLFNISEDITSKEWLNKETPKADHIDKDLDKVSPATSDNMSVEENENAKRDELKALQERLADTERMMQVLVQQLSGVTTSTSLHDVNNEDSTDEKKEELSTPIQD